MNYIKAEFKHIKASKSRLGMRVTSLFELVGIYYEYLKHVCHFNGMRFILDTPYTFTFLVMVCSGKKIILKVVSSH